MVPLAQALRSRGHEILWATAEPGTSALRKAGFEALEAGLDADTRTARYREKHPDWAQIPRTELPGHMIANLFGGVGIPEMVSALLKAGEHWRPSLFVHDSAEFAAAIAAGVLEVPHVTHSYGTMTPPAHLERAAAVLDPVWRSNGLQPQPFAGSYQHLYIDVCPPSLQSPEIQLVAHRQLEQPVAYGGEEEDGRSFRWKGEGPHVYLTFGTRFAINETFRTVVDQLGALDVEALVTVGPKGTPAALGPQPANVRIERYVPQTEVLEGCRLVISHAGSGTFLAALGRGIPQLCLPQGADQFRNAAACEQAGAGLQLRPDAVTPNSVSRSIKILLEDPGYAAAAAAVAKEIASMPSPDEVAVALEKWPPPDSRHP